jgi:hypothetical protein
VCGQNPAAGESERDLETGPLPEQGIGIHPHPHPQLLQIAGMTIRSTSLSVNLQGCDSVYLMAATLGIGPDRLIARASVNRMSRAVIYQAEAVEFLKKTAEARRSVTDLEFYRSALIAAAEVKKLEAEQQKK